MANVFLRNSKPLPRIERPPGIEGPPSIQGPSGAEIFENCRIEVGRFFHEISAMCETVIEGPGPSILGGGLDSLLEIQS